MTKENVQQMIDTLNFMRGQYSGVESVEVEIDSLKAALVDNAVETGVVSDSWDLTGW